MMKLISSVELEHRTEPELAALFGTVSKVLTVTERGSAARRNALASLENISRARVRRLKQPQLRL
jgi:hypothetical protein